MKASLELLRLLTRHGGRAQRTGSVVQSLLFAPRRWSVESAQEWAREHGYRDDDVDVPETGEYLHLRQRDPAGLQRLRTITFGHGIKAVVGWPAGGRAGNGKPNGAGNGLAHKVALAMRAAGDSRRPRERDAVARSVAELVKRGARVTVNVGRSQRRKRS